MTRLGLAQPPFERHSGWKQLCAARVCFQPCLVVSPIEAAYWDMALAQKLGM